MSKMNGKPKRKLLKRIVKDVIGKSIPGVGGILDLKDERRLAKEVENLSIPGVREGKVPPKWLYIIRILSGAGVFLLTAKGLMSMDELSDMVDVIRAIVALIGIEV